MPLQAKPIPAQLPVSRLMLSKQWISDCLRVADFTAIMLCSVLAHWIYQIQYNGEEPNYTRYLTIGLGIAATSYLISFLSRSNIFENTLRPHPGLLLKTLMEVTLAFGIAIVFAYLFKIAHFYSRGWLLVYWALVLVALTANRWIVSSIARSLMSKGQLHETVAIFGDHDVAQQISERICGRYSKRRFAGVFSLDEQSGSQGNLHDLINYGQKHRLDHVIVALPIEKSAEIKEVIRTLETLPVELSFHIDFKSAGIAPLSLNRIGGMSLLRLHSKPMKEWNYLSKRIEDIVVASTALVFFAPLFAFIALAIRLDSPGPVFFKQRRHGFNHQTINVLKFRTMNVWEDGKTVSQAQKEDPRVTRVGRFLRKTSLDELPQFINVLRGEMSAVGPRPHALAHNHYYSELIGDYKIRHKVKPGISGWAQVNGYRGETKEPELMAKRVEYDIEYIENWSLWLDIKILIKTLYCGFIDHRAY